jgi:hypothetical protein
MEKKGLKFGANQILHATMKLYQFTENAVNKILLQRSVMFHILYDSCPLYKSHVLKHPWRRSGTKREKRIKGAVGN